TPTDTSYTDSSFTSPFGVCAMIDSTNQTWINRIWAWDVSGGINANDGYFGNSIKMHCMVVMSGNWWKPAYSSASPDFSLSSTPSSQTVTAGSNTTYSVSIAGTNGFSGRIALTVTSLPTGVTASFSPAAVTNSGSATLNIITSNTLAPG